MQKLDGLEVEEKMNQELVDSLKTHPDCELRISLLQNYFQLGELKIHEPDKDFSQLSTMADFQLVDYFMRRNLYASSLKHALLLLKYYPENEFLQSVVSVSLANIYIAQQEHKLRDFVPRPDDDYDFNLQRILLMVENIRLSQLKILTINYIESSLKDHSIEKINNNQYLLASKFYLEKVNNGKNKEDIKNIYQENFPDGYFIPIINY